MSRVGKQPVSIPKGVDLKIDGQNFFVKGPKGELNHSIPFEITLEQKENSLCVIPKGDSKQKRIKALHGLTRTLIANMIHGVNVGFQKELKIVGIGYRANISGNILNLFLGYSHPIKYIIPDGIQLEVTKDNRIIVKGSDKQKVGQVAAEIRYFKQPEPYKGKGIMYVNEKIHLKVGKAGAK